MVENRAGSDKVVFILLSLFLLYKSYIITTFPFANDIRANSTVFDSLLLTGFALFFLDFDKIKKFKIKISSPGSIFLYFTIISFILSVFYFNLADNFTFLGLVKSYSYIIYFIVFFQIIPGIFIRNMDSFNSFLKYIVYFAIVSSFFSILSYHFDYNLSGRTYVSAVGIFLNPNTTAFVYTLALPVLYYLYFSGKIKVFPFVILFVLLLYVLIFTLSRAGYLGFLLSTLVFMFTRSKKLFFAVLFLLLLFLSLFSIELFSLKTDSSIARGILLITAINMILASPHSFLFGYGTVKATEVFFDEKNLYGNFELAVNNPHNFILLLWLQFGFIVTIAYLFFLFNIILSGFRLRRKNIMKQYQMAVELLLSILLGLILQNMFEEIMVVPEFPLFGLSLLFLGFIKRIMSNPQLYKNVS